MYDYVYNDDSAYICVARRDGLITCSHHSNVYDSPGWFDRYYIQDRCTLLYMLSMQATPVSQLDIS